MIILAIETSCDDTSVAVVSEGYKVLSSVVSSQNDIHGIFGGVVPEVASRAHLENISPVFNLTLKEAGISVKDIDGIAVTIGPGLVGSLLVGISFAKGLSFSLKKPLLAVNHIEGHFFAPFLEYKDLDYPYLALVASGGHTGIYLVKGFRDYELIGQTRDDAAGESFDKVAKLLGLGYPGGVAIERFVGDTSGDIDLPKPLEKERDFSFSGLKTAVLNIVKKHKDLSEDLKKNIAGSFQRTVVEILTDKTISSALNRSVGNIVISGGVSANRLLRETFQKLCLRHNLKLYIPSKKYCTDNAGMIGAVGINLMKRGIFAEPTVSAIADWDISELRL
ncbi:MAG: tRNA (adenosine(37)-N6)-threonylcarbamoyltransferase complex transferase subunit TsaD [Proteobacteria bacterium]|nr:tRNA (adenosine(37)-N6)-threonylcarbamoyltransferase complex transferase subunit TsaD [Pseudomonadota bacterium]